MHVATERSLALGKCVSETKVLPMTQWSNELCANRNEEQTKEKRTIEGVA